MDKPEMKRNRNDKWKDQDKFKVKDKIKGSSSSSKLEKDKKKKHVVDDKKALEGPSFTVDEFLDKASPLPLEKRRFALLQVNSYTNDYPQVPLELGVTVFSLERGIISSESRILTTSFDSIHLLSARLACKHFFLPPPPFLGFEGDDDIDDKKGKNKENDTKQLFRTFSTSKNQNDPIGMLMNAMILASKSNAYKGNYCMDTPYSYNWVLFASEKEILQVKGALQWFQSRAGIGFGNSYPNVFPLEELATKLVSRASGKMIARHVLESRVGFSNLEDSFATYSTLACDWHRQKHCSDFPGRCARHRSRSAAYLILKTVCPMMGINMNEVTHFPVRGEDEEDTPLVEGGGWFSYIPMHKTRQEVEKEVEEQLERRVRTMEKERTWREHRERVLAQREEEINKGVKRTDWKDRSSASTSNKVVQPITPKPTDPNKKVDDVDNVDNVVFKFNELKPFQ